MSDSLPGKLDDHADSDSAWTTYNECFDISLRAQRQDIASELRKQQKWIQPLIIHKQPCRGTLEISHFSHRRDCWRSMVLGHWLRCREILAEKMKIVNENDHWSILNRATGNVFLPNYNEQREWEIEQIPLNRLLLSRVALLKRGNQPLYTQIKI